MMQAQRTAKRDRSRRDASVLILVLVTLAMLGFGAYAFSESMLTEYRALRGGMAEIKTRAAADSGVVAMLASIDRTRGTSQRAALLFDQSPIRWQDARGDQYTASIYASAPGTRWSRQQGLFDESAKLNVNSLLLDDEHILESRQRLMMLPGMTQQAADSLLDWLDPDDIPREFGAEASWYLSNGRSYVPRQGPLESLQELLLVRGFSATLLFGEDANGNGWLDVSEDDGDASLPEDNQDGVLASGLSQWLTVVSAESNYDARGKLKVYVNDEDLAQLYRRVDQLLGEEAARFIVALRMNGPMEDENAERFDSESEVAKRRASAAVRAQRQATETSEFAKFRAETIDGFAINRSATYTIRSTVDLLGQRTEAFVDDQETILKSPWGEGSQNVSATLAMLDETLAIGAGPQTPARVNVMLAPREVLLTVPNLPVELATAVLRRREQSSGRIPVSVGWLADSGALSLNQLRRIAPYVCARGDVYSGVSVGTVAGAPQATVALFKIDATLPQSRLLSLNHFNSPVVTFRESVSKP